MNRLDPRVRDAIGNLLDLAPPAPAGPVESVPRPPRPHALLPVAAAIVAIGIAGVAIVVTGDEDSAIVSSQPPTTASAASVIPEDGRLTVDPLPAGLRPGAARRDHIGTAMDHRIYAADHDAPERGPVLLVQALPGDGTNVDEALEQVEVQSTPGQVAATQLGGGEFVVFGPVDGYTYFVTGYNVTRAELLDAAEVATYSEAGGPVIEAAGLPQGVSELAVGGYNEGPRFQPATGDRSVETVGASWNGNDGQQWLGYVITAEDGDMFAVNRIGRSEVRDVVVAGHRGYAYVEEFEAMPASVTIVWTDGNRTVFLSATGYTIDELLAIAETLRPATSEEWSAMLLAADEQQQQVLIAEPPPTEPTSS